MAEEVADKGGGDKKKIIIKHVEEILKSTEKDEMKFRFLVGLIKTDQVSNKDVVNTVLHLLVGGEFEIETSFIIQESQNVFFMLEVLKACPPTLQAEIWSVFTAMLKKSRRNLNACTEVGLIEYALRMLENADDVVADLLVEMLGVLASYSITVKELRMLFALLKAKDGKWTKNSVKLLSVLRQMPQRHGPDDFFSFPGKKGSFISLPPVRTWPYQNGWAFSCWIRLDPVTGVTVEKEKPYLYCFRTSKGVGYSAHFLGSSLVITSMKIKGKGFQHCVKYEFSPRKWYMVTICHVYYRWSRSELRCYVDGELVSFTDMSWLVNTNDPFDKCFLGASSDGDPDTMFCGQMSAVYLFNEYLTANQVAAIYSLGPGYKSQFRFDNENSTILSDNTRRVLYEGRLTSSIVFMYNPIACDSQLCLESSPKGNTSYFIHSPHALMLNDVKAVITRSLLSTLHSLGGVEVLFPLFGQLDLPVSKNPKEKPVIDLSICGNLMGLLCDLLESSSSIQEELLQNKGFLVISYFLEKSSREHITIEVLNSFLKLTQYLVRLPTGGTLLKHLFDHILFNPGLWIYASVEVQNRLYSYLATEFINDAQIYNNIRRVSAVLQTMHTLKYYYWVVNPKDRSGLTPKGVDGPRPTRDEIVRLRSYMLLYVVELIRKGQGILEDELQSILNYLTTLHEDDNLMDVLLLLVTLMAQHPSSMVPSFDKKNGIRTVFKLLASPSESLRIQALKLLGFFLMRSTHKRKYDAMNPQNLFSLIGERLMLNMQSITTGTYNVLFVILTERLTLEYCWEKHQEPESYYKLENPAILKVVATMIRQSKQTAELMEVKKLFLSDLTIMCNNNKENRRTLLQMSVWQEWLFSMAYIYPRSIDEQKITDMVMSLFRMLLHHAIKFEYGGWRVWVDTLAILHSKVAYEDFRIHMSKMYQQYERQRVDNVYDPQERRQHPISTISGVSDETLQNANSVPKSSVQISEIPENEIAEESIEVSQIQEDTITNVRQETIGCEGEVEKSDESKEKEISLPADGIVKEEIEFENTEEFEGDNKVEMVEIDHKEEKLEKDESETETKKDCDGLPEEQKSDTAANCDGKPENVVELSDSKPVSLVDEEKSSDGGQFDVRDNGEEKENRKVDGDGTRNTEQHSELKADGEPDTNRKSSLKEDGKPEERKPESDAENTGEQKMAEEQNDCKIEQVEMAESEDGQNEQREKEETEDNNEKAETEATKENAEIETSEDNEKSETEATEEKTETEATKETIEIEATKEKTETEATEEKTETEATEEKTETEATKENTETEATKENTETEATKENTETEATKENTEIEATKENTEIEATKENTETEATKENTETEATKENTETEATKENTETEATKEKTEVEATKEKTEVEATKEKTEVEATKEKTEIEATKEKTEIEATKEKTEIEATKEKTEIEATKEKTEIEATKEKTEIEATKEKTEIEATKEKTEIEATKEKTEIEATKEKTEIEATKEKTEIEATKENNTKIEIDANEEKTESEETKDNKNTETETTKDSEKTEIEATKENENTETTKNNENTEIEATVDNKKIETETVDNEKTETEATKDSEKTEIQSIKEDNKTETEGTEEKSETETTKEKTETEKEDVESTENDKTVCDDKDMHAKQDDTVQIKGDETESESKIDQLEDENKNKEITEDNKTLENTNDQDGDAPDLQNVAEDNSENLDAVEENGQAEGPISYVSKEDPEAYMPGLEYETQPGPTGYYTQEGEMIYLNITEDSQMIYQTEDGRLVYQYPDENGHVIYHTGGAEMGYDVENPSDIPEGTEYVDDNVTVAEGSYNLDAHAEDEQEPDFSKYQGEVKHNEGIRNSNSSECKSPDSGASARTGQIPGNQFEPSDGNTGYKSRPTPNSNSSSRRGSHGTSGSRHLFSPGPRAPPFRIPEFRWSYLHQKLLSDLLFSIETDIQVWKSHSTRAVVDFVNSGENHIYVVNVTHMISQLADNLIMSCGGLLPLLAAATSPNGEIEILEPNQGLSIEQAVSILQRIMNMTDIVVFTSSTNFSELEQEKNMPPGGILRQCLRLVCTAAVRNCLECKHRYTAKTPVAEPPPPPPPPTQRQNSNSSNGVDPIQSLIGGSHPSPKNIVENLGGQSTPIKDAEKLLQDMDITRLRAVVYRDVDETKQAQFLALAIVYFTSVLMVSKYRDILEPPSPASTPTLGPHRSAIHSPTSKEISVALTAGRPWGKNRPAVPTFLNMYKSTEFTSLGGYNTSPASNNFAPDRLASLINTSAKNTSIGQLKANDFKNKSSADIPSVFEDEGSILPHMASCSSKIHTCERRRAEILTANINDNNTSTMSTTTTATTAAKSSLLLTPTMIFSPDNDGNTAHKKGNETDEEVISLKDDPDTSAESLDREAATVSVAADVHVATNGKETDSSTSINKVSTDNTEDKSNDAEAASEEKSLDEKSETEAKDNDNTKTLEGTEAARSSNEDKAPAAESEALPNEGVSTTVSSESVVNAAKDSGEESGTPESKEEEQPVNGTNPGSANSAMSSAANTNSDTTSNTAENAASVETVSRDELIAADGTDNKVEAAPKTIPHEDSESAQKSPPENVDAEKEVLAEGESREENRQEGISSIRIEEKQNGTSADPSTKPPENLELTTKIPATFDNLPLPSEGSSLTERLEKALGSAAPLLREIFVDFAPFLSKTLIGSHGQELLVGGLVTLKQSSSVVELVMLLCSQEWQNSLQKHAGLAFIELVNEGRLLAHATRDHIVRVANEAEFILTRMRAEDVQKHAEFESLCAQTVVERKDEEKLCDHLITSAKRRDHAIASVHREKIVNILTNKHGAWGQVTHDLREFWKLDLWEDDFRRRRRFVKNPHGSTHPEATLKAAIEHGATEDAISQAREAFHAHLASVKRGQQQPPDYTDEELLMEERDFDQEFSEFPQFLMKKPIVGPVALSTSCKLISMGLAITGIMSITKTDLYFEMDEEDKDNKKIAPQVLTYVDHLHGKWHFSEIRAVFSRRYLLQNVAIEIFTANRTAVMFAFPDHVTMKKVVNALPKVGIGIRYGLNQARRMSLASGKQLFKLSNMTQKWQRREISNFDYLVYLNTVAGRTFNDLNQYPIFPWVIVNYESNELDMSQPNNFRDLSKPIGALNPARKQFFNERYASWEHEQIPPFHYGTHYSTAAFTLNWLIRVEPFTTLFLNMQGGKFDHANRTFFSVGQAWKNCQRDTSDVKELIPEFYYLPEMFVNQNKFNFGYQDGDVKVDDITLPPWAKTPDDFVRVNRMALESEFVSCQLHHWIDLIFGYKQRGPEAVRSTNVFYYLTYEGSVNLETMTDPVMKEAIENQIRSFGQTPTQLLTEPHPPRSSLMHLTPMMFSSVQDDLCMLMKFLSNSPITHVAANTHPMVPTPAVITITCNHNFAVNKWNPNYQQQGTPTSFSSDKNEKEAELPVLMDQLFTHNTGLHKRSLGDNFDQRLKVSHSSFVTTADNRFIFACGFWDKSFRIFATESARIVQVIYGHFDIVTCITKSESNTNHDCYIVTGSKDCTVMVWQFNSRTQAIVGDIGTAEKPTPKATLTGHQTEVVCVAVFSELGLVVSGSKNGPCLVHALTGDLLRSLDPPEGCFSPELITMSREAFVLVKFDQGNICSFTINGRLLRHVRHKDNILSMILSRGGEYLMTGGESGVADVWRTHDLTLLYSYPKCDGSIHSLSLSHDERLLLLGLGTGCLLVFFIDFNKWHHEYQDRY